MSEHEHGTPQGAAGESQGGTAPWGPTKGTRKPWSSETIAVVGTGVTLLIFIVGTGVTLLIAMLSGFLSLNNRLDELTRHREDRLASVQMSIESRVEAFRQAADGNLSVQSARITAFEVRLAELEVRVQNEAGQ